MARYTLDKYSSELRKAEIQFTADFIRATGQHFEDFDVDLVQDICAQARLLTKISLDECNGVTGPDGFAKWDDTDQRLADQSREIAEKHVLSSVKRLFRHTTTSVHFQGDPRGASVEIKLEDKNARIVSIYVDGGYQ